MFDYCDMYAQRKNWKQACSSCIGNTESKAAQLTTHFFHTCAVVSYLMPWIFPYEEDLWQMQNQAPKMSANIILWDHLY